MASMGEQNGVVSTRPVMADNRNFADFEPAVKKPKRNKFASACAILASLTSILLGYMILG